MFKKYLIYVTFIEEGKTPNGGGKRIAIQNYLSTGILVRVV